ncbi:hypothetical protein ZWY2020_016428 [Hordeum vulgare]|nr:hypothetical protein ZWY2020_016428 [Hordeum vulgare]
MTRTIVTQRGRVHITCAVLDDAVQANVRVTLRLPRGEAAMSAKVHGHINARIDTFTIGCALFSRDADEAVDVSVSRDSLPQEHSDDGEFCHSIVLPLDRRVLVVPVGAYVEVTGELVLNGSSVVHVSHSIKVEGEQVQSQGVLVQENYCPTTVDMWFRVPWA